MKDDPSKRAFAACPTPHLSRFPHEGTKYSTSIFQHGSLRVKLYAPRETDGQQPHDQDEAYVVLRGTGTFVSGDEVHEFGPGDFLWAPAGLPHRFADFTSDLATWVLLYGPEGGECCGS